MGKKNSIDNGKQSNFNSQNDNYTQSKKFKRGHLFFTMPQNVDFAL